MRTQASYSARSTRISSRCAGGWLDQAQQYGGMISDRLGLDRDSFVIDAASNDGYLLATSLVAVAPYRGIEPAASTAQAAEAPGIPVEREFSARHSLAASPRRYPRARSPWSCRIFGGLPVSPQFNVNTVRYGIS
jgi:hypothetical protein